jgi:hypothetical protein
MAQGDWVTFEEFSLDLVNGVHNLGSDTLKVALIDNAATEPVAGTATPEWAADFSGNEVSGTGYTAGGETLSGTSTAEAAGVATLDDTGNVLWSQNAAGPTDIYWAILYNDTAASKECIGFLDMGGPVSLVDGDVTITWNASGILTVTVTA